MNENLDPIGHAQAIGAYCGERTLGVGNRLTYIHMWRRYALLSVLLLSLWGVIPTAAACAFMAQQDADCCAGSDQPCETEGALAVAVSASSSCCSARPLPTGSTIAVEVQRDRRLADPMAPEHAKAAPVPEFPSSFSSPRERTAPALAPPIKVGHPQVYLLTGRLRL